MGQRIKAEGFKDSGVGVDIGNFSIKVAAFRNKPFSKNGVFCFGIEHIPKNAPADLKPKLIVKAMEKAGIAAKRVNISVCGPDVISRHIRLPLMQRYELQDAIELEWDKYVSLKKDEVIWDYTVLDTRVDSAGVKYLEVLLVAAKKNFVEEKITLIKGAGLEPQVIDIDSLALANAFKFIYPSQNLHPIVILNLGEYFTNEVVLKQGLCWFSRDIHIGGYDMTEIISERMHLALPEAEKLKCNLDNNNRSPEIYDCLRPILDNLVNELKLSLEYIKRELQEEVNLIYISGGSAHLYQLDEFLSQNIGVPVMKWKLTQGFKLHPSFSPEELEKYSPDLAVAIGLALAKKDRL